ncbi:hypothetical protein ABT282_08430 [Streptomyces sp. NPDC000927]|uniref:hypothetical protein n=1 Tax=Streptomyces sp. NPDC000927 TaxID=3154371 RepID=UPI003324DD17
MTWRVKFTREAAKKAEKLILPDEALLDGTLITSPDVKARADARQELLDRVTNGLAQQPYSADLGTARSTRKLVQFGSLYVSTVQSSAEACHVWWHQVVGITILDVEFTPSLRSVVK